MRMPECGSLENDLGLLPTLTSRPNIIFMWVIMGELLIALSGGDPRRLKRQLLIKLSTHQWGNYAAFVMPARAL